MEPNIFSRFLFAIGAFVIVIALIVIFFFPWDGGKTKAEYAQEKCLKQPEAITFQMDGYTFLCEVTPWPEN